MLMDIILGTQEQITLGIRSRVPHRFFDDIDLLRQRWRSDNTESVGELRVVIRRTSEPTPLTQVLAD